jgi:uncharacterized protein YdhG (YjbR/CyaY superfamily)
MKMDNIKFSSIDEYIDAFEEPTQRMLIQLRNLIKVLAPDAQEVISYNMPAFKYHGVLVYFAAHKNHIGFYPMAAAIEVFQSELTDCKWAKGSIQFPLTQPLPIKLISDIVKFRVEEQAEKAQNRILIKKKMKSV